MKDKINVKSDDLIILKVPANQQAAVQVVDGNERKLTLKEWRRLFPKPLFKWDKS